MYKIYYLFLLLKPVYVVSMVLIYVESTRFMCVIGICMSLYFGCTCVFFVFSAPSFLLLSELHSSLHSKSVSFLHLHHYPLQVLCFSVPTHLAHAMLGKQRDLFQVMKVFPTIFSSLLLANHLCLLNKLL